ncbi:unnamed protein product [Gadus morhua 'NCC']
MRLSTRLYTGIKGKSVVSTRELWQLSSPSARTRDRDQFSPALLDGVQGGGGGGGCPDPKLAPAGHAGLTSRGDPQKHHGSGVEAVGSGNARPIVPPAAGVPFTRAEASRHALSLG